MKIQINNVIDQMRIIMIRKRRVKGIKSKRVIGQL